MENILILIIWKNGKAKDAAIAMEESLFLLDGYNFVKALKDELNLDI